MPTPTKVFGIDHPAKKFVTGVLFAQHDVVTVKAIRWEELEFSLRKNVPAPR
jgi:hypothetical protein